MHFPRISYSIGFSGINSNNQVTFNIDEMDKRGFFLKKGVIDDENTDIIAMIPAYNSTGSDILTGKHLTFNTDGVFHNDILYKLEDLAIAIDPTDKETYLIIESTNEKLWCLPKYATEFLEMDKCNTSYSLSIINDKLNVVNIDTYNTYPSLMLSNWNKEVIFVDGGAISNDPEITSTVTFELYNSSDINEQLSKSVLKKYDNTYKLSECWMGIKDDILMVYSNLKLSNDSISKHAVCTLGYIEL